MALMPVDRSRSARAVATLNSVDPQFRTLCKMLYGENADPEAVWADVFAKMGPDQSDIGTSGHSNFTRRLARAGNALGLAAGTAALGSAARDPHLAETAIGRAGAKAGRLVPKAMIGAAEKVGPKKIAAGAVGLQAAEIGFTGLQRHVLPHGNKIDKADPKEAGFKAGQAVRRGFKLATKTPKRRLALAGGGALALVHHEGVKSARRQAYQEYYGKADTSEVTWEGTFAKVDVDKQLAFGWASVTKMDGIDVIDRQGDFVHTDDMEDAAYEYVLKCRVGGDMHKRNGEAAHKVSDLVESFMVTDEKVAKMGLPEDTPRGWWVGFKIHDADAWEQVKKGERTGFSIHGRGRRAETDIDTVMSYR